MNKRTAWVLFGAFWSLVLLVGWTRDPSATASTTQAIERLIRSTRRTADARAPFVSQEAPAEEARAAAQANDDLEQAIVLMQEKDYAAAVPLLEKSIKLSPTIEAIWEALGWSYYHTGRPNDAERLWLQYKNLRPESPKSHSLLAQLALLRNDWRLADSHLAESLRMDPQSYDIRYWYAQNLFRLGRLEPAVAIFEKLVEIGRAHV